MSWRKRRHEQARQAVLEALGRRGTAPLYDLMTETGMRSARVCMALVELEDANQIRSVFGMPDPTYGRRRRYYQRTSGRQPMAARDEIRGSAVVLSTQMAPDYDPPSASLTARCTCCQWAVSPLGEDGKCTNCLNLCQPGDPRSCPPGGFQ